MWWNRLSDWTKAYRATRLVHLLEKEQGVIITVVDDGPHHGHKLYNGQESIDYQPVYHNDQLRVERYDPVAYHLVAGCSCGQTYSHFEYRDPYQPYDSPPRFTVQHVRRSHE